MKNVVKDSCLKSILIHIWTRAVLWENLALYVIYNNVAVDLNQGLL